MDPSRLGDWVSAHRDVDWDGGELAEGDSFTQTLRLGGAKTKIDWTVVELDEPERAVWTGRGPVKSEASVVYELSEKRGKTTFDYTNSFDLPGGRGRAPRGQGRIGIEGEGRGREEPRCPEAAARVRLADPPQHDHGDVVPRLAAVAPYGGLRQPLGDPVR